MDSIVVRLSISYCSKNRKPEQETSTRNRHTKMALEGFSILVTLLSGWKSGEERIWLHWWSMTLLIRDHLFRFSFLWEWQRVLEHRNQLRKSSRNSWSWVLDLLTLGHRWNLKQVSWAPRPSNLRSLLQCMVDRERCNGTSHGKYVYQARISLLWDDAGREAIWM